MRIAKVTERISYIGVNDRRTALFENNWPIPYGVSYNSYLIKDEKNVLIDTVEYGSDGDFLCKIDDTRSYNNYTNNILYGFNKYYQKCIILIKVDTKYK